MINHLGRVLTNIVGGLDTWGISFHFISLEQYENGILNAHNYYKSNVRGREGKFVSQTFTTKKMAADKLQVYLTFLDGRWILTVKIV